MKKVLFLAYDFPPRNRIASLRSSSFAKYLPTNGWQPQVITEHTEQGVNGHDFDPHMLKGNEETKIYSLATHRLHGPYRFFVRKIAPFFFTSYTPYNWWRKALNLGTKLCSEEKFDAILATCEPIAALSVAHKLSVRFQIPWIADLRDSWQFQHIGSPRKRRRLAIQELRLCKLSSKVVTVSEGLQSALSNSLERRVELITNGFDPELYPKMVEPEQSVFRILYTGSLNNNRDPEPLFCAIENCLKMGVIEPDKIQVEFLGVTPKMVSKCRLSSYIGVPLVVNPRVSHYDALLRQMKSAILLVLSHPEEPGVLTGKIFDYLGSGRPILSVPDDKGAISDLLSKTGAGFASGSPDEIGDRIITWYNAWKTNKNFTLKRNDMIINMYTRQRQAKQLADLLDQTILS
jgi:glycosyltransferase involved in cell wall biosynthesis